MKLDERISKYYDRLNPNDGIIWKYISTHRGECCNLSIEELAACCNVSRSTVMRFAQKLDMHGYGELKSFLRWECGELEGTSQNILEDMCSVAIQTIEKFRDMDCDAICKKLCEANRIFVYGTGSVQRAAAMELKRMFLNMSIIADNILGESEFKKTVPIMSERDVVIIFSKSGESAFIKDIVVALKGAQIPIISLTHAGNNTLANMSNFNLFLGYEKFQVGDHLTVEHTAEMFMVMQILCVKFVEYMQKQNQ
ncbi:MAG: MurR/RpiR family transcriptional regulator [Lachnospiraceae bacterium]|nr:MurR/RpiR family transcriptional regulator [Lachnospiraceae bacterium]